MYRVVQNRSKLFFSARDFVLNFLNILIYFLELNNDIKYYIYVGRVAKRGVEGRSSPLTNKRLNFKLLLSRLFVSFPSVLSGIITNYLVLEIK